MPRCQRRHVERRETRKREHSAVEIGVRFPVGKSDNFLAFRVGKSDNPVGKSFASKTTSVVCTLQGGMVGYEAPVGY